MYIIDISIYNSGACGRVVCVLGYSARGCGFEPRRDQGCDTGLYPPKVTAGICAKSLVPASKLWSSSYANVMPIVLWRQGGSRMRYVSSFTQVTGIITWNEHAFNSSTLESVWLGGD